MLLASLCNNDKHLNKIKQIMIFIAHLINFYCCLNQGCILFINLWFIYFFIIQLSQNADFLEFLVLLKVLLFYCDRLIMERDAIILT